MSAQDYADYLFFKFSLTDDFTKKFGLVWLPEEDVNSLFADGFRAAFQEYGYDVGASFDELAKQNVAYFIREGAISRLGDDYTGIHLKINTPRKAVVANSFLDVQDVSQRIKALGSAALERALAKIALEQGWKNLNDYETQPEQGLVSVEAPASDRIVTFSDNQIDELDQRTTEVIDAVSTQNQIGDMPGLREIIVGQLKAGRELIRAGSFKLYFLEITLIDTLRMLAKRYEKEAIGGLASALIVALFKSIGIDA